MNRLFFLCTFLFIFLISDLSLALAQDSVWVKTLTFDDITKRRGKWDFPDSSESFRKILMYYTLKCDPRTTQDKYNCGEWDYLNYAFVYVPTGKRDSTPATYPHYRIGSVWPDSVSYTTDTTFTAFQSYKYHTTVNNASNETEYKFENGNGGFSLDKSAGHIQFLLSKTKMIAQGMKSGDLNKIKFYVSNPGSIFKNFKIRLRNSSSVQSPDFITDNLTTVYDDTLTFKSTGWNEIAFNAPYHWQKLLNLLVDISYERDPASQPATIAGYDTIAGLQVSGSDFYLSFDGKNDYIYTGNIPELNGLSKFTYETWLRVDKWQNWAKVMGKGSKFHIELGNASGDIYFMNRNPDNTYGKATAVIPMGQWAHIAMVFDGTQPDNAGRIKFYFNGIKMTLAFNGTIPPVTITNEEPFTLSEIYGSSSELAGAMKESRVWLTALDSSVIASWKNRPLDNTHPNYSDLFIYYPMTEGNGLVVKDHSGKNHDGKFIGTPVWTKYSTGDMTMNPSMLNIQPSISLVSGTYQYHTDSVLVTAKVANPQISIQEYEIYNYFPRIKNITYGWASGMNYTFNPLGQPVDSVYTPYKTAFKNDTLKYFGAPFDVVRQYEIGRYITPYGINLDLGPNGFTWIYDVTDYESLLRGNVDLEAGGQSELIDLKFLFIKGTPPRKVLKFENLWGDGAMSKSYKSLSDNTQISQINVPILPETKQLMLKTRLTGHGHNSNDGNYPHCCEWKDNTHYLLVNGTEEAQWHIFQYRDCASNPVFPQGGTWPGSREGWCPGDLVRDNDFELTNYLGGNSIALDYDITKVPADNLGMGGGNYVMAFQLFQYDKASFDNDAELYNVKTPNDFPYFSRQNPICANPTIVVRNNGTSELTSLTINYGVSGGKQETYNWTGKISPNIKQDIVLPLPGSSFWIGDGQRIFTATLSNPNGKQDNYPANDSYSTHFNLPDMYKNKVVMKYVTNKRPQYYTYTILDMQNKPVFEKSNLAAGTVYIDTLNLTDGCYTLLFTDDGNMGLSYWAYPDQGNGSLGIYSTDGTPLKIFNPDFGYIINYSFNLGEINLVQDRSLDYLINVSPNPADTRLYYSSSDELGNASVTIIDESGAVHYSSNEYFEPNRPKTLDISKFPSGVYFLNVVTKEHSLVRKFIKTN